MAVATNDAVLSDEALEMMAMRFRALADPNRLRLVILLMQREITVGDLAQRTGLDQPNISRHLAVLRRNGIVSRRSEGKRAYYRVSEPTVVDLCRVMCQGLAEKLAGDLQALPDIDAWKGMNI